MYKTLLDTDKPKKKVLTGLWKDLQTTSDRATAVARTVHSRAFTRWTEAEDTRLKEIFEEVSEASQQGYRLGTNKERLDIIRSVAVKTSRSPAAVKIRLKALGTDLSRKKEVHKTDIQKLIQAAIARNVNAG